MPLLVLSDADVRQLLSYADCVAVMRTALTGLATGRAGQPLRSVARLAAAPGLLGLMPSYLAGPSPESGASETEADSDEGAYGLKVITITPSNPARGLDAHQGAILVFDGRTGMPQTLLNGSALTEIRTAAMSVLATDLLARPGAADLAIIGTGFQGRAHVLAFSQTRPLRRIRVAGRSQARAADLAADLRPQVSADITACSSVQEAVAGADIIVTATSSSVPVLERAWIDPGAHINAVGAYVPAARELDGATVAAAALFADRRESLEAESGDFLLAVAEGLVGRDHFRGELGDVLIGAVPGRADDEEITIFESLGLGVEDLAAAQHVHAQATATGTGQWVTF
jgi:ornithine cyclodeaminase/alanine dehydrogenase-like protein (mu-crystallin family)